MVDVSFKVTQSKETKTTCKNNFDPPICLFFFFFIAYCGLRDYLAHRSATEQEIRMSSTIKSCNHQLNYVILTFPFQKRQ